VVQGVEEHYFNDWKTECQQKIFVATPIPPTLASTCHA
jgi:hypothetical protein